MTGRFAPTPSGRLHLGNVLCAMLAWASARSQNGRFLLRVEDVDLPRCPPENTRLCLEDLRFLGFDWDEEPLYQSRRTPVYEEALRELAAQDLTYPCFCTRAELHPEAAPNLGDTQAVYPGTCAALTAEKVRQRMLFRNPAIRLRVPDEEVVFSDGLQGEVRENLRRDCGDFVLRRSDGLFGYQLAAVVDDLATGVDEVVRGRDILTSTPRQIWLIRCLGGEIPRYFHIPLLTDSQGRRLAKRRGDLNLTALSKRFRPEEILGFLACACGLLEHPVPVTLPEVAALFDWSRVRREDIRLPADLD